MGKRRPAWMAVSTAIVVFLTELVIMLVLDPGHSLSQTAMTALLDSVLLMLVVGPFLYFVVYR